MEDWRKLAEVGDVTTISFARAEKGLTAQIAEHEARAKEAGIPPVLRGMLGEHAARTWAELGDEVAVKREIIRTGVPTRTLIFVPSSLSGLRSAWTGSSNTDPSRMGGRSGPATTGGNCAAQLEQCGALVRLAARR